MGNKVVIHVMGMDSSKYGGMERFNVKLSQSLWEKGYKSIFVYEIYPESDAFVDDLNAAHGEIKVINSRTSPLRFCRQLLQLIDEEQPLLIHAHFTKARFYAIPLAYLKGVERLVFTIHSAMSPKAEMKPLTRLWYTMAGKKAKVIAVSDNIESAYKSNWPKAKIKRIYLGVNGIIGDKNDCRKRLVIPSDQIVVLTIANFNHIKGLDVLCKAIALLKKRGSLNEGVCFYIVGQPVSDQQELFSMIKDLGLSGSIKMMGISNDVASYMCAADLYVQPSRSEGLPLALMEATSVGLPLIGTKAGGIPEIVKNGFNGLLVDKEDEEQLATAIEFLLHNNELRMEYGNNSHVVFQEDFSVEVGVAHTISYYELE